MYIKDLPEPIKSWALENQEKYYSRKNEETHIGAAFCWDEENIIGSYGFWSSVSEGEKISLSKSRSFFG